MSPSTRVTYMAPEQVEGGAVTVALQQPREPAITRRPVRGGTRSVAWLVARLAVAVLAVEYVADRRYPSESVGITESLSNRLSRLGGLKVVANSSAAMCQETDLHPNLAYTAGTQRISGSWARHEKAITARRYDHAIEALNETIELDRNYPYSLCSSARRVGLTR